MTTGTSQLRVLHVVGARPNFMKIAPVMRAFERKGTVEQLLIHTGQHYDDALSRDLFEDLEIPQPDMNLGIGSGSHAEQTGRTIIGLEPIIIDHNPDWVFTVGDVNSTLAAAIVSAKLCVPVAHVEAGLRSGDHSMPEEINRLVTDRLSSALFTTEPSANENLLSEGVPQDRIHYVGNVMIDTLLRFRERSRSLGISRKLGLTPRNYFLVTLHRPSNVDRAERLKDVLAALVQSAASCGCELVIPFHPRTSARIKEFGLESLIDGVHAVPSLRYLEFLGLMQDAAIVLTDSGGIQEETTALGIPCITLRSTTERPITITEGTNQLFDGKLAELPDVVREALTRTRDPVFPHLWDGSAAERIADVTVQLGRLSSPAPVAV